MRGRIFARMKGFKSFLMQGNVVELATAVIIGGAFATVVAAVVKFLMNVIGAFGGQPNFDQLGIAVGDSKLMYGPVITAIISFIAVAAVVYFVIVKPYEALQARRKSGEEAVEALDPQLELLTEIRDALRARS